MKEFEHDAGKCTHEKVTNAMGTFFSRDSDASRVQASNEEPEKVTNTVGTFKNERNGFKLPTYQVQSEKVANMVGTFFKGVNI